jgi:predicted nucleotidyltransferase
VADVFSSGHSGSAEPVGPGVPGWAAEVVAGLPYPAVFATVSGAHLYGFASADSDLDLRGVHMLPVREVVGLRVGPDTLQETGVRDGVELDVVTHELAKFCRLLLRPNGYVLEQLLSPLVVTTSPLHAELVATVPGLLTRHHAHHYLGFARTQWTLFERTGELKPALYTLRVLLTGRYLMYSGDIVCDLGRLAAGMDLPYVAELIALKAAGEHWPMPDSPGLRGRLYADVGRLTALLEQAHDDSHLPDHPTAEPLLHDLVVQSRMDAARTSNS